MVTFTVIIGTKSITPYKGKATPAQIAKKLSRTMMVASQNIPEGEKIDFIPLIRGMKVNKEIVYVPSRGIVSLEGPGQMTEKERAIAKSILKIAFSSNEGLSTALLAAFSEEEVAVVNEGQQVLTQVKPATPLPPAPAKATVALPPSTILAAETSTRPVTKPATPEEPAQGKNKPSQPEPFKWTKKEKRNAKITAAIATVAASVFISAFFTPISLILVGFGVACAFGSFFVGAWTAESIGNRRKEFEIALDKYYDEKDGRGIIFPEESPLTSEQRTQVKAKLMKLGFASGITTITEGKKKKILTNDETTITQLLSIYPQIKTPLQIISSNGAEWFISNPDKTSRNPYISCLILKIKN